MSIFSRAAAIAFLLAAGAAVAQTGGQTPAKAPAEAPAEAPKEAPKKDENVLETYDAGTVLATVGDRQITLGDLIEARRALPPQSQAQPAATLYDGLLNQLATIETYAQAGADAKLGETAEFKERLDQIKRELLARAFFDKTLETARAEVTEADAKARYDEEVAKASLPEEVRARHILVKTEDEAKAIKAAADGGADFAKLASEKSTGPSKSRGGDLGFFTADRMVPEFSKAAFALKVGEISAPVKTAFGWHVIKLEERRKQEPPKFEELKDQLIEGVAREKAQKALDDLRAAKIQTAEKRPPYDAIRKDELKPAE